MSIFEILLLVNSGLWIILALTFIIFLILRSASFARLNRYLAEPTPVSRRYDMGNLEDFYKRNKAEIEKHADEFPTEAPCLFSNFPFREDIAKERKNNLEEKKDEEKPRSEYISPVVEVNTGNDTGRNTGNDTGRNTGRNTGNDTGRNTGNDTRKNTGNDTRKNTGDDTRKNTGDDTGRNTGDDTGKNTGDDTEVAK